MTVSPFVFDLAAAAFSEICLFLFSHLCKPSQSPKLVSQPHTSQSNNPIIRFLYTVYRKGCVFFLALPFLRSRGKISKNLQKTVHKGNQSYRTKKNTSMSDDKNNHNILPEMDPVSEKQEQKIREFLEALVQHWKTKNEPLPLTWSALDEPDQRIHAYKFLTARKWVVQHALDMAIHHEVWKLEHAVDTTPFLPTPFPVRGYNVEDVNRVLGLSPRPSPLNGQGPPDFYDKCHKTCGVYYQSGYHFWDKAGHPVFYQIIGRVQVRGVVKQYQKMCQVGEKTTVPAVKYHIMENEVGLILAKYNDIRNNKEKKNHDDPTAADVSPAATDATTSRNAKEAWVPIPHRRVLGVTVVIDGKGLGYSHVYNPAIEILRAAFATDAANYPEFVHRILVVNCPSMIKFLYSVIRGALDARVQQKITFVSEADTPEFLKTVIDEDKIPDFLGGSCSCEGGCVVMPSGEPDDCSEDGETVTEDITVTAGKTLTKTVEMQQGEEVTWEFVSTTGYDIKFSATFHPSSVASSTATAPNHGHHKKGEEHSTSSAVEGGGNAIEVIPKQKLKDDSHSYRATTAGTLVLVWDNHSSWFKAKKLQMRVAKQASEHSAHGAHL